MAYGFLAHCAVMLVRLKFAFFALDALKPFTTQKHTYIWIRLGCGNECVSSPTFAFYYHFIQLNIILPVCIIIEHWYLTWNSIAQFNRFWDFQSWTQLLLYTYRLILLMNESQCVWICVFFSPLFYAYKKPTMCSIWSVICMLKSIETASLSLCICSLFLLAVHLYGFRENEMKIYITWGARLQHFRFNFFSPFAPIQPQPFNMFFLRWRAKLNTQFGANGEKMFFFPPKETAKTHIHTHAAVDANIHFDISISRT